MKKKLGLFAVPFVLWATAVTAEPVWNAMPTMPTWGVTPFFGADAVWRHMDFWAGQGENVFKHNYPQGDIYTGLKFCDYLGVQLGYEASSRKNKTVTLIPPYIVSGITVTSGNGVLTSTQLTSTSRIKGPHLDIVGYLPICNNGTTLTASIGLAYLKLSARYQVTGINGVPNINIPPLRFSARKTVMRLMGGIQQQITDCVGVRASVTWQHTAKFRNLQFVTRRGVVHTIRPKDSVNYGLGFFVTF